MNEIKNFTIIIPCIKLSDVRECIKNIRKFYKNVNINVCLNEKVKNYKTDNNLRFIYTKSKSIGQKRNLAVKAAKTKYIAFIDSDAFPKKNWIESSYKYLKLNKVGIISGPNINPKKQNYFEHLIGLLKKSFLISMKPGFQRGFIKKAQFVKFLPSVNWILKRKTFYTNGKMNSQMLRNEDWDFVYKLRKKNLKVFYSPKTIVFHKSGSIKHFITKRFKYGFFMLNILNKPNFENYYFYFPMIFCAFLLSFPLVFFSTVYGLFYLSICSIFLLIVFIEALKVSDRITNIFYLFVLLIICTLSPGFGILAGIILKLKKI